MGMMLLLSLSQQSAAAEAHLRACRCVKRALAYCTLMMSDVRKPRKLGKANVNLSLIVS